MSIHVHVGVKDVLRFLRRQYNINVEQPRELPLTLLTLVCGYSGGCPVPVLPSTVADVSGVTPLDPICWSACREISDRFPFMLAVIKPGPARTNSINPVSPLVFLLIIRFYYIIS